MGKPKGPPPTGPCRLCGDVGPLTWSHIIPRWTYKRIAQTGEPGRPVPVQVRHGVAMLNSDQLADFLLCSGCEDRLHHWETYVSEIARNGSDFPALTIARANIVPGGVPQMRAADISGLDVDKIARFAASVLWRAAACPHLLGDEMRLGPYFDEFGSFIRNEAPFPSRARLLLQLVDPGDVPQLTQMVALPSAWRHGGHHWYAFMIFGMSFEFVVGGHDLSAFDCACLPRTGRALIVDGHRQFRGIADEAHRSVMKGTLAERASRNGSPRGVKQMLRNLR